jgi:hypothetical protein
MSEQPPPENEPAPAKLTREEIVVRTAAFLKDARPKVDRLIVFARPRAEAAGQQALRYVREHETEIKQAAAVAARGRLRWPFGILADALMPRSPRQAPPASVCPTCDTANAASARFCNQCGSRLVPDSPPPPDSNN